MRSDIKMKPIFIKHSAKGSEWDEHQYVKKVDGDYYYPDGYTKGRTISSLKENQKSDKKTSGEKSDGQKTNGSDTDSIALEVIRGRYGDGQDRKDALGDDFQRIQDRVNELMGIGKASSTKLSEASEEVVSKGETAVKKAVEKKDNKVHTGVDMNKVMSVYNKKKRGD